jgi:peptide deformylase
MKLPIRYYGHPDLRAKADPIQEITTDIVQLAQDMIETMIAHNGVGLAGPQVGRRIRIFVRRFEGFTPEGKYYLGEPEVIINPVLTKPSKETEIQAEGCLSIPGIHAKVPRPKRIHLRYQNLKGEWIDEELDDFLARNAMHENDHLNGVLHIDRISPKDRNRIEPMLRAIKQKYNP